MNTPDLHRRFRDTYSDISSQFATRMQDEESTYYTDLQQLGAKADTDLRQAYENYLKELQAAWAGDDAMQRAAIANRNFQREYAKIQADYFKDYQLRQERMLDACNSLTSQSRAKAFDNWIEYLSELRKDLGQPDNSKPSGGK